ncbi:MAG: RagB/SusD family nutrient uptake outer membrane protein, partial [Flavobacteriaceae bacterium]|nr:RagB/SusD family nutrient uptake outer membrane protein [Flavobacteriaceae bacterium]
MKNKIIIILMLLGFVLACSEDFTETVEIGSLNPAALQNEAGINFTLTAAYSSLDGRTNVTSYWTATGDNWWMDAISDDAHKGSTDGDQQALFLLETYDWNSASGYLANKWRALYASVNRANAVIDLVSKVTDGDFTAQVAEARFLRGFFYFELQKIYGYVAYIGEAEFAAIEFNQTNTGDVWAQIESDFSFAAANLPDNQDDAGRANAWAAKSFLAKTYLYQNKFSDALTLFNEVINDGPYGLLPEFVENFSLAGENGPESIFAIQFDVAGGALSPNGNLGGTLNFGGPNGWCCGFYQPTQDLVNAFQTENGLPLLDTYNNTDVKNDYGIGSGDAFTPSTAELDPRLDYTVGRRGIDYNGWDIHPGKEWIRAGFDDISGPYSPKKNVYQAGEDANMGTGAWGEQSAGINYNIMRFADLLLMAAECAVEAGDLSTALSYVNRVRSRAMNMTYLKNDSDDVNFAAN